TLELVLDGDPSSTENLLRKEVYQIGSAVYEQYAAMFPPSEFMLPLDTTDEQDLLMLQEALDGDLDAMVYIAKLFQLSGNTAACSYWSTLVQTKKQDLSGPDADVPVSVLAKAGPARDAAEGPVAPGSSSEAPSQSPAAPAAAGTAPYQVQTKALPPVVLRLLRLEDGVLRLHQAVDLAKLSAYPACLFLALVFGQLSNPTMMVYTALHGTYGLLWLAKSHLFPDPNFERTTSPSEFAQCYLSLTSYFLPALLIAYNGIRLSSFALLWATALYTVGVFFHFGSDMQKAVALQYNPGRLITDKFFGIVRHPNYLGELMIYSSFACLTGSLVGFAPLAVFFGALWLPNMLKKEKSLSRFKEWPDYKNRVKGLIPFVY
ncbi:hypothetical protein HDU91_006491, partial [Kappamyces sp. JEL0680]